MREAGNRALCASIVVLLLAGLGAASVLQLRSPEPKSTDAPADEFSADRAWVHLEEIARAPHPIGSPAHDVLARYLQAELEGLGGTFEEQAASIVELRGYEIRNLMVRFPGSDPTGTILLATHYDSVPSGPGVGDAGVSVAALVETARALAADGPLRNDVIVMLTDGEEAGLFGGRAFVDDHPWAEDVDLVFNFEGRGVSGTPAVVEVERPTVDLISGIFDATPPLATSPIVGARPPRGLPQPRQRLRGVPPPRHPGGALRRRRRVALLPHASGRPGAIESGHRAARGRGGAGTGAPLRRRRPRQRAQGP